MPTTLDVTVHPHAGAASSVARPSRLARTFFSLRVRLLALVLLALIPAFALILYNAYQDRQDARDQVREDASTLTQLSVLQQRQLMEGSRQLMATLTPLAAGADLSQIDRETCGPALGTFLKELTFYSNLGLANPDGTVLCSAANPAADLSIADRASFQAAMSTGAFAVGKFVADPISGKDILDLTAPIIGPDGEVRGAFFLDLDLAWLNDRVAEIDLPAGAVFTVFDDTATVLARAPDNGSTGQSFPTNDLLATIIANGGSGTTEGEGRDGTHRLYSYTHLTDPVATNLYAVVGVPTSTAYAEVNDDLMRSLAALGIVALLALAAAWLGSDVFLIRQTRQLVGATRQLSNGDLRARSGLSHTSSEIGTLARSFDEMAARLEQRAVEQQATAEELRHVNESLEQRVDERTKEVAAQARELRMSNSELEDFTYVVSHDLKEPLRGIEAFTSFLEQDYGDKLDEEGKRYLEVVRGSALRMKELIEDLLELSRVGRQQGVMQATPLGDLVSEVVDELRFAIDEKGTEVVVAPDFPQVVCDRVRMKELFRNLVSNAVKFNNKPDPRVEIAWAKEGDGYRFSMSDNGIGIEPEYFEKVFQIFQRLGRREDYPGTGAGLTICKKIVEMHGGTIGIESTPGEGSTFWFTIPQVAQTGDEW